jgi:hypothetical protein
VRLHARKHTPAPVQLHSHARRQTYAFKSNFSSLYNIKCIALYNFIVHRTIFQLDFTCFDFRIFFSLIILDTLRIVIF